ncbi:hypothetical protein P9X10_00570 [Bacillus cereus]|nr:hypothetical protein [Bacillus cereus]
MKTVKVYKVVLEGSATGGKPRVVHIEAENRTELDSILKESFDDETVVKSEPYSLADKSIRVLDMLDGVPYEISATNHVIQQGDSINDTEIFIKHGEWMECYIRGYDFDSFEWKHVFHVKDLIKLASEQGDLDIEDFQYEELDLRLLENLSSIVFEYLASGVELDGKVSKVARTINENPITPLDFKISDMVEGKEYTIHTNGAFGKGYMTFIREGNEVELSIDGSGFINKKNFVIDLKGSVDKLKTLNLRNKDYDLEKETLADLEGLFYTIGVFAYGGAVENESYAKLVKRI